MANQNYKNHARYVIGFHVITLGVIIISFALAVINLFHVMDRPSWLYAGLMPLLITVALGLLFFYTRQFPLKAQDRAIRAEENFRYFILTGKPLNQNLTISQVIALRFAADSELPFLVEKAVSENLSPKEIKSSIISWRADIYRA